MLLFNHLKKLYSFFMRSKIKTGLVGQAKFLPHVIYEVIKTNFDSILDPESKHLFNLNIIIPTFDAGSI